MLRCSVKSFLFQRIIVLFLVCSCLGCIKLTRNNLKALGVTNDVTTETDEIGYVVQPNYDHPKFKELSAAFDKEAHRFEIDACEFKYNDQSFFIGDSMAKIIEIFGEPDEEPQYSLDESAYYLTFNSVKLYMWFAATKNSVRSVKFRFSDKIDDIIAPFSTVKFRKIPYKLDMTLNEFMELSDMNHNNVGHNSTTFYIENEKECKNAYGLSVDTEIGSIPAYNNVGGGHLTIRGDFDEKVTGSINNITVSLEEL